MIEVITMINGLAFFFYIYYKLKQKCTRNN